MTLRIRLSKHISYFSLTTQNTGRKQHKGLVCFPKLALHCRRHGGTAQSLVGGACDSGCLYGGDQQFKSMTGAGGLAVTFKGLHPVTYFRQADSAGKGLTLPKCHKHLEYQPEGKGEGLLRFRPQQQARTRGRLDLGPAER